MDVSPVGQTRSVCPARGEPPVRWWRIKETQHIETSYSAAHSPGSGLWRFLILVPGLIPRAIKSAALPGSQFRLLRSPNSEIKVNSVHKLWDTCGKNYTLTANIKGSTITVILMVRLISDADFQYHTTLSALRMLIQA